MADEKRSGSKGIPHHPLVAALASDPSKPPEKATKLFGYPGPAAEKGSIRLWLDTDLTTYVDVPDAAILHSQTLPDDQGTWLWVDPEAKLTVSSTQSHEVQADFLGGSIAEGNLAAAAPAANLNLTFQTAATVCPRSLGITCTFINTGCFEPSFNRCITSGPPCGEGVTAATVCRTLPPVCEPVISSVRCPTRSPVECPVISDVRCRTVAGPECPVITAVRCPTRSPVECPVVSDLRCPTQPVICEPVRSVVVICPTRGPECVPPASRVAICPTDVTRTVFTETIQVTAACPTIGGCVTIGCRDPIGPISPIE
jgi:hypothetical protein